MDTTVLSGMTSKSRVIFVIKDRTRSPTQRVTTHSHILTCGYVIRASPKEDLKLE